jgi:hypothetical protein
MLDFVSKKTGLDSRFIYKSRCVTDIMMKYFYKEQEVGMVDPTVDVSSLAVLFKMIFVLLVLLFVLLFSFLMSTLIF